MPKAFDPHEKQQIRANMLVSGLRHFTRSGLRATRVDDICRDVGIAKGSFYAFFPSKEEMFMAIVEQRETRHREDMYTFIDGATGKPAQRIGGFFDLILRKIEDDPILNLVVANGEIGYLTRKLGPERMARSQEEDKVFAREAARRWKRNAGTAIDAADLLNLMAICLSVAIQRRQMMPAQYAAMIRLLRELFVGRLLETSK